ncbi:MAG: hypothetical protein SGI72_13790 [Planctomycetota bacterium]|nr:hypothetical protein [Planctomycetota bacterium]
MKFALISMTLGLLATVSTATGAEPALAAAQQASTPQIPTAVIDAAVMRANVRLGRSVPITHRAGDITKVLIVQQDGKSKLSETQVVTIGLESV